MVAGAWIFGWPLLALLSAPLLVVETRNASSSTPNAEQDTACIFGWPPNVDRDRAWIFGWPLMSLLSTHLLALIHKRYYRNERAGAGRIFTADYRLHTMQELQTPSEQGEQSTLHYALCKNFKPK